MIRVRSEESRTETAGAALAPTTRPDQPQKEAINLNQAVSRYRSLVARLVERLQLEDAPAVASYLGLSRSNYYAKRSEERPFQYGDVIRLVERYGTEEDRADLSRFLKARDGLYTWMEGSPIPLARFRSLLGLQHHKNLVRRGEHPDTWKLEDMEQIGAFIEGLAYVSVSV